EAGKYQLFIDQYSSHILTMIETSNIPSFMRLKEIFKQPGKKPQLVSNMTQKIQEIGRSSENIVLYSSQFVLRASAKGNCNITVIPLTELSDRGSFAFRKKNYPYSSLFFKATISFKDKGDFYEQTELKYRFSRPCAPNAGVAGAEGVDLPSLVELFYFVLIGLLVAAASFSLELLCGGSSGKKSEEELMSDKQIALTAGNFAFIQNYHNKYGMNNQINGNPYGNNYATAIRGVNFDPSATSRMENEVFKSYWVFGETDKWYAPDQRIVYRRRSSAVRQRKRNGSF
uniref:Uncharacterized protein n=1 Tax=Plectus sambesii TaxID=2011161 RepID=A0A914WM71_9BILA